MNMKRPTINIDGLFILFLILLTLRYYQYIMPIQVPMWDPVAYLTNARNWLNGEPLLETFRSPLISWLIAGIWGFTGENWIIMKPLSAIFVIGSGILLYLILRKYKGGLFAFTVVVLTMYNTQVFFYNTHIYTEGMSLFFLVSTLYLLKSDKEKHWILAGITTGLTFAARYYIIVQAITILIVECIIRKNWRIFNRALYGAIPIISLVAMAMYLKTGTFKLALESAYKVGLSSYYIVNSIEIWGLIFIFVPLAFLFRRTYVDNYNHTFIAWFIVALLFWSSNTFPNVGRFRYTIQFTPAVYYLAILTVENMYKRDKIINLKSSFHLTVTLIKTLHGFIKRKLNDTTTHKGTRKLGEELL